MFKKSYCNTKFFSPLTPSVHPFTIATGFPRLLRPPGAPQGRQLQKVLHGQRQRRAERCRALRGRRHAVERCRGLRKLGLGWLGYVGLCWVCGSWSWLELAGLLLPEIVKLTGANWWCFELENDVGGVELKGDGGSNGSLGWRGNGWCGWFPYGGNKSMGVESWEELTH